MLRLAEEYNEFWRERFKLCLWDDSFKDAEVVAADGGKFKIHSVLLGLASPYMRELLSTESEGVSLILCDYSTEAVKAFLTLVHTGSHGELTEDYEEELESLCLTFDLRIEKEMLMCSENEDDEDNESRDLQITENEEMEEENEEPDDTFDDDDNANSPFSADDEDTLSSSPRSESASRSSWSNSGGLTLNLEENLAKPLSDSERSPEQQSPRPKKVGKRILTADLKPSDLTCQDCGKVFPVMYKLKVRK